MSKGKKRSGARPGRPQPLRGTKGKRKGARLWYVGGQQRSEERFSRNAETDLVCRLLLEKKKTPRKEPRYQNACHPLRHQREKLCLQAARDWQGRSADTQLYVR